MYVDSYYTIGNSHTICQDYAIHSQEKEIAVLSDGCSRVYDKDNRTINAHTDVGARLLALAAINNKKYDDKEFGFRIPTDYLCKKIILAAADNAAILQLPEYTLSATLLILNINNDKFQAIIAGDGVIAARRRDTKQWEIAKYEYIDQKDNILSPTYLRYWINNIKPQECRISKHDTQLFLRSYNYESLYDTNEYDTVMMFSDGIHTFTKNNEPYDAIGRLTDIRRLKGCFITRNLIGMLKEFKKEGIVHQDDISAIGIHIDAP